jgi:hypothetical protein
VWKQQLSRFTAPLAPKDRWTVAQRILASADAQRLVGQAMLATTWEWVGESEAWKAAQHGEHHFNSWNNFVQQFDPDGVFQKAIKAYRSSELKKQKALAELSSWPPELLNIASTNP